MASSSSSANQNTNNEEGELSANQNNNEIPTCSSTVNVAATTPPVDSSNETDLIREREQRRIIAALQFKVAFLLAYLQIHENNFPIISDRVLEMHPDLGAQIEKLQSCVDHLQDMLESGFRDEDDGEEDGEEDNEDGVEQEQILGGDADTGFEMRMKVILFGLAVVTYAVLSEMFARLKALFMILAIAIAILIAFW